MDCFRRLSFEEIAAERAATVQSYGNRRHPIGVMLWNVRSAYNVGSIFRTCDAARVECLILTGYTPSPDRGGVHKTALGAERSVPWEYIQNPHDAINRQRVAGHRIVAVELVEGARSYTSLKPGEFPATFVFGNELVGIDEEILACCDEAVVIPMFGMKHSLNVAVSVGIMLYRALETLGFIPQSGDVAHRTAR